MAINDGLLNELKEEAATTRRVLERIPAETFAWKPHEKSMTMGQLSAHVADMFSWLPATVETDEMDFANGYEQPNPATTEELTALFDKNVAAAAASLQNVEDAAFMQNWTLRNGEEVYFTMPKIQVLRGMVMNHIVHHRGQLSVYLRMNDIPVPGLYGPSADEPM
jgi:uncharacterized damage-inducible protein DinB